MTDIPRINEIYRHFKGNLYRIVALAVHSETGERMVVYQALYGDYAVYVRELSGFMGKVDRMKYPDAGQENRFELLPQILGQGAETYPAMPDEDAPCEPVPGAARERREEEKPDAAADRDTRTEAQPEIKPDAVRTQVTMPDAVDEREQESAQPELDPFLMQFLDADSYGEKLNLLAALHARITGDMIDTMAASLDVEVNEGELEERYAALKGCLLTLEKYECHRLR